MSVPPDGIIAKIERADEHIRQLNADITAFLDSDSYRTVTKTDPDIPESVLYLVGPDPPLRFSVIVGEIVYQLRSVLDHLVWQLVLANGNTPTRKHQFPICSTIEEYERSIRAGHIKGVSMDARNIIESLQPYKRRDADSHLLSILRDMNNKDKHRLLILVAGLAKLNRIKINTGGAKDVVITSLGEPSGFVRGSKEGTKLMSITFSKSQPEVQLDGDLVKHVALDKFGQWGSQPVIPSLQQIREAVAGIVGLFIK